MLEVNACYSIGLEQRTVERSRGDDDYFFVLAGYPAAVKVTGSWPDSDPNYHTKGDIPEKLRCHERCHDRTGDAGRRGALDRAP
jgi:hypothetical protein